MQVTQQQAVPYQFFQGELSGGVTAITWPDQFEGLITDISVVSGGSGGDPVALLVDASDVPYAVAVGLEVGSTGIYVGSFSGNQVVPSGSVLQLAISGASVQVAVSGWLLSPPGSAILAE